MIEIIVSIFAIIGLFIYFAWERKDTSASALQNRIDASRLAEIKIKYEEALLVHKNILANAVGADIEAFSYNDKAIAKIRDIDEEANKLNKKIAEANAKAEREARATAAMQNNKKKRRAMSPKGRAPPPPKARAPPPPKARAPPPKARGRRK